MNDLAVFQNPEFGELRTAEHNGETWFCLAAGVRGWRRNV